MKTLLFTTILLLNMQAFAVDTTGFQTLKNPEHLEFAKSLNKKLQGVSDEDKQKAKKWAEQVTTNVKRKELNKEQKDFICKIQEKSNTHLSQEFKTKADALLGSNDTAFPSSEMSKIKLYVFVTLSMKPKNLQSLIREAKKYGAQVVLRGIKNNSFMETVKILREIAKEESEGVTIDPTLFRKYGIKVAPTFVLAEESSVFDNGASGQVYDQVEGNISIRYALERMATKGDLKDQARDLLK